MAQPWSSFPPLLILANNHIHKQTQYLGLSYSHWNAQTTKTRLLPSFSLVNTHAKTLFYGTMNISYLISSLFSQINFLNATPHTIELLSVPAIGNLCSDSCTATAVKTSFLWCQSVMTPWDIVACVCTSVNMYCECMKSSYRQMPQNMDIVKSTLRERLDLAGCATKRTDFSLKVTMSS